MSIVQYDKNFDRKVEAGARALLKDRADRGLIAQPHGNLDEARQEAKLVLLTAMALEAGKAADAAWTDKTDMTALIGSLD